MDKFATLEPVRLYQPSPKSTGGFLSSVKSPTTRTHLPARPVHLIGRLPIEVHLAVLTYLATSDVPAYARVSKALGNLARDERVWEARWRVLGVDAAGLGGALEGLGERARAEEGRRGAGRVPVLEVQEAGARAGSGGAGAGWGALEGGEDDEFGDFATAGMSAGLSGLDSGFRVPTAPPVANGNALDDEMGDFVGGGLTGFSPLPSPAPGIAAFGSTAPVNPAPAPAQHASRQSMSWLFKPPTPHGAAFPAFPPSTTTASSTTHGYPNYPTTTLNGHAHPAPASNTGAPQKTPYRARYAHAHTLLRALLPHLAEPPHLVLAALFPGPDVGIQAQAQTLHLLLLFLSPAVRPVRKWEVLRGSLRSAVDRFDANMLTAFDAADAEDGTVDERGMCAAAHASWEVFYGAEVWASAARAAGASVKNSTGTGLGTGLGAGSGAGMGAGAGAAGMGGEWEMGKVWAEKRAIFYEGGRWDSLRNFTTDTPPRLDFTPMDAFMEHVLATLREHGARAVRVFPPEARVLLAFAERVAGEVVGEYITPLLTRAREVSNAVFLQASAAAFGEAWRMVDVLVEVARENCGVDVGAGVGVGGDGKVDALADAAVVATDAETGNARGKVVDWETVISRTQAEDVVYRMFEPNMDEYLDEEVESVKQAFEVVYRGWEREMAARGIRASSTAPLLALRTSSSYGATYAHGTGPSPAPGIPTTVPTAPRFVGAQNPAQMKRNVLTSFTNVLLLPVTIVPRAVGGAVGAVGAVGGAMGSAAVQGIAMLNPQRWAYGAPVAGSGGGAGVGGGVGAGRAGEKANGIGYSRDFGGGEVVVFDGAEGEAEADEKDEMEKDEATEGWGNEKDARSIARSSLSSTSRITLDVASTAPTSLRSAASSRASTPAPSIRSHSTQNTNATGRNSVQATFDHLQLFLSLDVALELIHADRDALKRVETFAGYPGGYGHRVRETIEEVFILLLQAVGERHVAPGFQRATDEMRTYQPGDHDASTSVAPLVQFFELAHIGDMIQSMVQVFFDKELAPHIDRTDFLNGVVREKKRFENMLDDAVAAGLNAGTDVLMNQVDHIITTLTQPREYYPPEDAPLDLGPTKGCREAIKCLETHCSLLKGSTSREVLEVFYQEVGIRLLAILQKHLKRQIISLTGGFQVIADLNAYYTFVSSLKVPSITSEFSHLKMLGHVYVVEDAKDLAQIVRDVTRYGGAYRPEDIYEFIQRRSDWKKIEKTVDKTMYNLSFKEDCVIG